MEGESNFWLIVCARLLGTKVKGMQEEGSTSEHLPRNKALVNMLLKRTTSQLKYEGNTSINQEIYF